MYSAKQRDDFRHLFTKEYKHLYYYSLQITRQPEASKDIVSEVFARVWEHWADFQQENMSSMLMVAVRRKCIDFLRSNVVASKYAKYYIRSVDEAYVQDSVHYNQQLQIEAMMKLLPEPTRTILYKCYVEHLKYDEVAKLLRIHHDTVKRHIMKALKMLRDKYAGKSLDDIATDFEPETY